jgi:hypothetical protein
MYRKIVLILPDNCTLCGRIVRAHSERYSWYTIYEGTRNSPDLRSVRVDVNRIILLLTILTEGDHNEAILLLVPSLAETQPDLL